MTPLVDETQALNSLLFYAFLNHMQQVKFHCAEPHSLVYSEMRSHCIGRLAVQLVPLSLLLSPASLTTSGHPGAQTAWTDQTPEYTPSASQHSLMILPTGINSHRTLTVLWPLPHKHAWALAPGLLYVCVMTREIMHSRSCFACCPQPG